MRQKFGSNINKRFFSWFSASVGFFKIDQIPIKSYFFGEGKQIKNGESVIIKIVGFFLAIFSTFIGIFQDW